MTPINQLKVLVADDERVIADTLAIILNNSGYTACAVYSGEMAIDKAATFLPDLLISDVIMGGMTGIEAATAICSMLPRCKILLFSGQATTVDLLKKARDLGHTFELMAKPVHPKDLLIRLRLGFPLDSQLHVSTLAAPRVPGY